MVVSLLEVMLMLLAVKFETGVCVLTVVLVTVLVLVGWVVAFTTGLSAK